MRAKNSIFHNSQTEIHFSVHMHKRVHFMKNELETNRLHAKGEVAKKNTFMLKRNPLSTYEKPETNERKRRKSTKMYKSIAHFKY